MDEKSFDFEAALLMGEPSHTPHQMDWEYNNHLDPWWLDFVYEDYDWNDPQWRRQNKGKYAWLPVLMKNGMFFMVTPSQYKRMSFHSVDDPKLWGAKIDRDPETGNITGVYARRYGRADEPHGNRLVYAHREVMRAIAWYGKVDHANKYGLDCRGTTKTVVNLRRVSGRLNNSNTSRYKADGLPPGVYRRGKGSRGQQMYGGQYSIRLSTNKVKTIRSRKWSDPERARKWYLNQLKRRFKTKMWVHDSTTVHYPVFPKRKVKTREINLAATRGNHAPSLRVAQEQPIPF